MAQSEPHVVALDIQADAKGTFPLKALDSTLWSGTATAVLAIKALKSTGEALTNDIQGILDDLDLNLHIE